MKVKYTCLGANIELHTDTPLRDVQCPKCERPLKRCKGFKKSLANETLETEPIASEIKPLANEKKSTEPEPKKTKSLANEIDCPW